MSNIDKIIEISEYETKEVTPFHLFTLEEERIIEEDFKDKIKLTFKSGNRSFIESQQYVGFIVLPNHIISIKPKISGISFINMIKYALSLPIINLNEIDLKEIDNYFDIIVLLLLQELEILFQRGLNSGYLPFQDNITAVKGKILFKEHIQYNFSREDRTYCSFSELSNDILENRIIKYALFLLCRYYFRDQEIESKILSNYKKLESITTAPISLDNFRSIQYTPLNNHYKNILTLCELILSDSTIDAENIGERTIRSFLIDMNKLFEKFVANLLKDKIENYHIELQSIGYADITEQMFKLVPDIIINDNNGKPILLLDTKYKKLDNLPEDKDRRQVTDYSTFLQVKNIGLIYSGKKIEDYLPRNPISLKQHIKLHLLSFNLKAYNSSEFEDRCNYFIKELLKILRQLENYD